MRSGRHGTWRSRGLLAALAWVGCSGPPAATPEFQRIAHFPLHRNASLERESSAVALAAFDAGRQLVYADEAGQSLGFVDIADPRRPQPGGLLLLGGRPRSLGVSGRHALVSLETRGRGRAEVDGRLVVVELESRQVVRSFELGGRPGAVAVGPAGRHAVVLVKDARAQPEEESAQGYVGILDLGGEVAAWRLRRVGLAALAARLALRTDPQGVAIDDEGVAAVTLQDANHLLLVDLGEGRITADWSTGRVDLDGIDARSDGRIELDGSLRALPREADGVAWLPGGRLATADEGEGEGGGRGITIFDRRGRVRFSSGAALERLAVRHGHYPEWRASKRGVEPERLAFAVYQGRSLLFVAAERGAFVAVYELRRFREPQLRQLLPSGVEPEALQALPARDLLVVASRADRPGERIRAGLSLYALQPEPADHPALASEDDSDGRPLAWGGLSGLTVDPAEPGRLYAVEDGGEGRILVLDASTRPARIVEALEIRDPEEELELDPEGLALRAGGGFWLVSEGRGAGGPPNRLLALDAQGRVERRVELPEVLRRRAGSRGFEGVAAVGSGDAEQVFVAFQEPWPGDSPRHSRIARFTPATGRWRFFAYPLEPASRSGGAVGLSGLAALDAGRLAVIERDAGAGDAARVKRIQAVRIPEGGAPSRARVLPVLRKQLLHDLLPLLEAAGAPVPAKPEGLAITPAGELLVVTDNDYGIEAPPETHLLRLPAPSP